jgi:DNA-binding CsgD family transcriptional regulator
LGWLRASNTECDLKLKAEVQATVNREPLAIEHFSRGVRVHRPSGARPYLVQFSTLAPDAKFFDSEHRALAIGFVTDPDAVSNVDEGLLCNTFGLTAAEARIAQEVLSGDSLEDIARRIGVSENTAKTQLQSVYGKTNTHRQAQLVKLLMGFASTRIRTVGKKPG